MPYILIAGIAFGSDFWIKRHMDRKYARYVVHPGRRNKILIEKYYNRGAALNFLAKKAACDARTSYSDYVFCRNFILFPAPYAGTPS